MSRLGVGTWRQKAGVIALMFWGMFCTGVLAELLTCPDCTNAVSSRAAFCPKCGCPADSIKVTSEEDQPPVETRTYLVRVKTDTAEGYGVGVDYAGEPYVVVPRPLLDGCNTLSLTLLNTNSPVHYASLEISKDAPLARLATSNTNMLFLPAERQTRRDLSDERHDVRLLTLSSRWASQVNTNLYAAAVMNPSQIIETQLDDSTTPFYYSVLSDPTMSTIIGIQVAQGWTHASNAIPVTADAEWLQVKPAVFRAQSLLLVKARRMIQSRKTPSPDEAMGMQNKLTNTEWITDGMDDEATGLAQMLHKWR
jgi:hypothetical protein